MQISWHINTGQNDPCYALTKFFCACILGLKVNTEKKTKVMVSEMEKKLFKNKIDPCSLWEKSHGQFSAVHKMWKLGSWHMCKIRELLLGW